ncbi:ABC transporter ATP-binding protein [Parvularcula dongshanensis]|uniref:ABC-2 type transport system ATP-binding protein n=1 Tax=Parvularcula dongshanensis TaxID=1173995 RepID=A0A840I4D9_9PROT|nr:ATP-binding cassette domain-containing protein [Parvularcula dongshanensis]MBB4659729.1 ABC-2 type transport system ATP-binding protein [Parvularcula dongshanensis]
MTEPVLSLEHATRRYGGFTAVDDLSFAVRPGEIYGFLGQNGAGKTTTLRMIMDIVPPTSGTVRVLGSTSPRNVRRRVGYLPEERGLYRKMKAADSIAYFARLKGVPRAEARSRADALLERFGLGEFRKTKIEALSKGMAQKVQLLSVIAHEPELLILDEPFSGLDPVNQQLLEDMIGELRAGGRTIVFSTHVMEHAERLCDRFLMIAHGKKVFEGTLAEARALDGERLVLVTPDDPAPLRGVPGIASIAPLGGERFALLLNEGADSQAILAACLQHGVTVNGFGADATSLHELFFRFAGASPAPDVQREAA